MDPQHWIKRQLKLVPCPYGVLSEMTVHIFYSDNIKSMYVYKYIYLFRYYISAFIVGTSFCKLLAQSEPCNFSPILKYIIYKASTYIMVVEK